MSYIYGGKWVQLICYMSSWDSEVQVVSEFDEGVQSEVARIEGSLALFLEQEYQEAIFSDANYVPVHLLAQKQYFELQLHAEVLKQVQITNQINDAEFKLKELDAKIEALRNTENAILKARADEEVGKREAEMHGAINKQTREQQQIRLNTRIDKLKSEIEKKRKNDEKVLQFLNRAIQKEEDIAEQLRLDIEEMRKQVEIQGTMGNLPISPHENNWDSTTKYQEDRKASLKASIQKLKEYIRKNQQYLQQ